MLTAGDRTPAGSGWRRGPFVEGLEELVRGSRRRERAGQDLGTDLVTHVGHAGRAAQALLELVTDQGPGEVELLLGALGGEPLLPQLPAVGLDLGPHLGHAIAGES